MSQGLTGTTAGFSTTEVTTTPISATVNSRYYVNNAGLVTITLPATASVGDSIEIRGKGAGGWKIAQNAGQTIYFGSSTTTPGAGGYLQNTLQYDCVHLECMTANTSWLVTDSVGNITVV